MGISYEILKRGVEFREWAMRNGIRDPIRASLDLIEIDENGITNIEIKEDENGKIRVVKNPLEPSDEEIRKWLEMEEAFYGKDQ